MLCGYKNGRTTIFPFCPRTTLPHPTFAFTTLHGRQFSLLSPILGLYWDSEVGAFKPLPFIVASHDLTIDLRSKTTWSNTPYKLGGWRGLNPLTHGLDPKWELMASPPYISQTRSIGTDLREFLILLNSLNFPWSVPLVNRISPSHLLLSGPRHVLVSF